MANWIYKTAGGVTIKTKNPDIIESVWENVYKEDINEMAINMGDRFNMTNGFIEPFVDSGDVTLTNAVVSAGYVANTVVSSKLTLTSSMLSSSNSFQAGGELSKAIDGSTSTVVSCIGESCTFTVDLGASTNLNKVGICTNGASFSVSGWTVYGSNDNSSWTTLVATAALTAKLATEQTASFAFASYRYIKFVLTYGSSYVQFSEFYIYGYTTSAATITLNAISISGATAGKIVFRGYNIDEPTSILDIGSSGSNKIEVYVSKDGNTTWSSALNFITEALDNNIFRFTSEDFDLTTATSVGVKIQSFARTVAPNFKILEVYVLWTNESSRPSWEELYKSALDDAVIMISDRYNMEDGFVEPFNDSGDVTLTNAVVSAGYVANTSSAGTPVSDLLPTMTAATTSGVTISASEEYGSSYAAWKAADKNTSTRWLANVGNVGWLKVDFGSAQKVMGYTIRWDYVAGEDYPAAWTFEGSATGADGSWTTLDTQASQTFTTTVVRTFNLSSTATYRYFRLNISARGGGGTQLQVQEFGVLSATVNLVATMTSNTTPSGYTASASSIYSTGYEAYRAFNKTALNDRWASATSGSPWWLRYGFPSTQTVIGYSISTHSSGNGKPTAWRFEYSTDGGTNWSTADTQTGQTLVSGAKKTYFLPSTVNAPEFRLYMTGSTSTDVQIVELEILGTASSGSVNPATIVLTPTTISDKTVGRIVVRGYNVDAPTSILDIGSSGNNKIEVYVSKNGNSTWSSALEMTGEMLSDNTSRFTSSDIDLTSATSVGVKIQSFARTVAPNFRILEAYILWK